MGELNPLPLLTRLVDASASKVVGAKFALLVYVGLEFTLNVVKGPP